MGSSVENPALVKYVLSLVNVAFLLVPPAPSSTIIKSASAKAAPISVPPSMSNTEPGATSNVKSVVLPSPLNLLPTRD